MVERTNCQRTPRGGWVVVGLVSLMAMLVCGASCGLMLGPGGADRSGESTRAPARVTRASDEPFRIYISRDGPTGSRIDVTGLPVRTDVVLLYEQHLGTYPRVWSGYIEHGGTPVGLDLVSHLRKVREDVAKIIPDRAYDGLAVLDLESRALLWKSLAEEYRMLVRDKIRASNPGLGGDELERAAEEAYNSANKRFLRTTIAQCRSERPNAVWGFYYFPQAGMDVEEYAWLAEVSDAMFPSAYPVKFSTAGPPNGPDQAAAEKFSTHVGEKVQTARLHAGEDKPVYLFVRQFYHEMNQTYGKREINEFDQRAVVLRPQQEGADGIIFWNYATTEQGRVRSEQQLQRMRPLMMEALRRDAESRTGSGADAPE